MSTSKDSYKQILKATTLFGSVQVFSILISIAKSKIAALLIGVSGIGTVGVLNSTLNLIVGITKLGLDVSAVKELSLSNSESNKANTSKVIYVIKRLTWITGIFGAILTILFSSWLSTIAFGNTSFTFSFVILSLAVLFNQITTGNLSILQGLKRLKGLAKTTVFSSFFTLVVTVPIYYCYGEKGIIFVIVLSSIITFLFSWYYTKFLKIKRIRFSIFEVFSEGKRMMQLGFVLSIGSLVTLLTAYILQIFIANFGGIEEVGFYNAAFVIINTYVSVIFNAMSKDYFPRLIEVSKNNDLVNQIVNQQALVSILLITPIIIIFLILAPIIVKILYTKEFLPIIGMLAFGVIGTLFKAVSWCLGFVIIAKGDSKLYLKTEVSSNALLLLMMIFGYVYNGLTGVGLSYLVYYIIYLVIVKQVTTSKYKFHFTSGFKNLFLICILQCFFMLCTTYVENSYMKYFLITAIILFSIIFTLIQLNKYVNLADLIKGKLKK